MTRVRTRAGSGPICSALVLAILIATTAHGAQPAPADREADARRLEQQLVAPCCWRQQGTLPAVVLLLSGAGLVMLLRRFTVRDRAPEPRGTPPAAELVRRLENELDAMD